MFRVPDITNVPITKEQISFRNCNHKIYIVICNKTAMHTPNENAKEILDDHGITTYPHGTNFPFIKYFDGKDKDILYSLQRIREKI